MKTESGVGEASLERIGLSDSLLDGAGPALRTLAGEIGQGLNRPPDAGDLLVLLASVPEGLASRTLAALGVNAEKLASAVEAARGEDKRSGLLPDPALLAEIEEVRRRKEGAVGAQKFVRAAELRDRERALRDRERELRAEAPEEAQERVLAEALARLGLE